MRPLALVAVPVMLALAACAPTPAVTPTPEPTYQCTPEAGGPAFTCSQRDHEDMLAKDKLYAEAEQVFREYMAEDSRITFRSTESSASPRMRELVTGDFLARKDKAYAAVREARLSGTGGDGRIIWVRRSVGLVSQGSVVALETCTDSTNIQVMKDGKPTGATGKTIKNTNFFIREGSALKIIDVQGGETASC